MAESSDKKSDKNLDTFADDLDSMLTVEDSAEQQVGLIDDDEAIDRLLVGDDSFAVDNEMLVADEPEPARMPASDIDEFGDDDIDDLIAGLQITPQHDEDADEADIEAFNLSEDAVAADSADEPEPPLIDEVVEETLPVAAVEPLVSAVSATNELEKMTEIDEFSDFPATGSVDNADFLLADFDISADESLEQVAPLPVAALDEPAITPAAEDLLDELIVDTSVVEPELDIAEVAPLVAVEDVPEPTASVEVPIAAPQVDYSAELAGLLAQINELKKQHKQVKQEIEHKAAKEDVNSCLDTLDTLQTEHKKSKRSLDSLANQKPVAAYVASGLAATALLIAVGLGVQSFIAKSQISELIGIMGTLQEQVNSAPTADAAEKEMLRKQLDELALANTVTASQLAELTKAGQGSSEKPSGDLGKQLTELTNQDMQMGAAIEALQNKVAALDKGKTVVVAKPAPKKTVVVEENWAVNLVAFKQDWYAKRKAEEFAGKGVPAKVSKTETKGENWYRLSVDGFKTQYEAASYAARIKKTLNLDSVWVAKNKD